MSLITKISEQKRNPNRRSVYLDDKFAFGCNLNVVAKFHLRENQQLSEAQLREILFGSVKQECFDSAMRFLTLRLHSKSELSKKLHRREWGEEVIQAVLADLERLGYLDDERFAKSKALSAAQNKHHGRRRAFAELMRSGVSSSAANRALAEVYDAADSLSIARKLIAKQSARFKRLDPLVARRRLAGLLQRRGFDYDVIRPLIDEVLGSREE